jgi:ATP-dependent DNA helicase RecG
MTYEFQNIELKQSWYDDYLKWICGFANAQGGRIFIGKNDADKVTGLKNAKKLLEDLPNKIRDQLGLMPHINLLEEESGKAFLEIIIEPSTVPISLRGSYYWRSGSVKQELKGHALTEFLLKKMGMTWDRVVEEKATLDDIDNETIELFKEEAVTAGLPVPIIEENSGGVGVEFLKASTSEKPASESSGDDFGKNSDETSGKRRA